MSTNIQLLPLNNELIQIQNEVRNFFNWDVQLDIDSAVELLSIVESFPIEAWTRPQRLVTLANLRRRLVLRETKIAVLGAAVSELSLIHIWMLPTIFSV